MESDDGKRQRINNEWMKINYLVDWRMSSLLKI